MSGITYRPVTLDDAELASEVMTAAYPPLPQDPVMIRYRWENPRKGYRVGRFLAYIDERPAAFLAFFHAPWERLPGRHCEVEVWLDQSYLDLGRLREMWSWIEAHAIKEDSHLLLAFAGEDEPEMLAALAELGYERERVGRVWELDLEKHGDRRLEEAAAARKNLSAAGIDVMTVADWDDPEKLRKLFELDEITAQDIPHTVPILAEAFEDFVKRADAPDRRRDRWWIAVEGDRVVAMSYLKFPPVRGTVWTGYTCTHPDYRGRGIARGVKLQTLAQAVEIGVAMVCTDNDSENAPMLHINERLGYTRRPGFVEHHKRVESKGA